jgi:hypothetical protein
VEWDATVANAAVGTTDYSRAFIVGGDRSVEVSGLKLELVEVLSMSDPNVKPWYIPKLLQSQTRLFATAQAQLPLDIRLSDRYSAVFFQTMYGTELNYQDGLTDISMLYTGRRPVNKVVRQILELKERALFPAVNAHRVGRNLLLHADGGKLGNAVNPLALQEPQYQFNTATPTSGDGVIRALYFGLMSHPSYTLR